MTGDKSTGDKAAADPATLIRQVRVLERKLARSEESRVRLEEAKDRFDTLHRNLFRELDEQKALVDEKNNMLESLSSKLSKYLAPQIYQSIFSGRQDVSLETKRKKLTVFFSDIKDFTQITEDLQAEDLASLLNEYFTEMSRIALEHGATIDKFIGDAMLMFFGDPESKGVEEDAKACVRMAIAMQRRMKDLQEDWRDRGYEHPFRMRIGINTGFCNVGNFGSNDRPSMEAKGIRRGPLVTRKTFDLHTLRSIGLVLAARARNSSDGRSPIDHSKNDRRKRVAARMSL